ncbi:IMPACT family member YigZ [Calidithermus terrae]|uniref:IMPACT family member YigZ n=1 Tax=Calidithermus terrae TaxID=1408545 RepID=A0A399E6P3_9DEIN|nr:YigZ family protein [Calidithermus terrae]RIH79173.1 IMPACT family member YigZ [Calidithermus terrae]
MTTLAAPHELEQLIQKSRFIARAAPAATPEEALAFLERVREREATHNCWAYRVGPLYRFSDDGEPGGTAGQPILRAIEGQGLDRVMVVVTRHFGGVKLGTGGLVRAYGGVAAECLRQAPRREVRPRVRVALEVPFELSGVVYGLLERGGLPRDAEGYTARGLRLELTLEAGALEAFQAALRDASRGVLRAEVVERLEA